MENRETEQGKKERKKERKKKKMRETDKKNKIHMARRGIQLLFLGIMQINNPLLNNQG